MSLLNQGYNYGQAITVSDSVDIPAPNGDQRFGAGDGSFKGYTDAIYVGTSNGTSTVAAIWADGRAITFTGLLAGTIYPYRVRRINSTGTAGASNLVALYIL